MPAFSKSIHEEGILLNGFTIKDKIKAIKIYSMPNFILRRNNTKRAKEDNNITDFTNSFEFIFN